MSAAKRQSDKQGADKLIDRFRVGCLIQDCGWQAKSLARNPKMANREGARHIGREHADLLRVSTVKVKVTEVVIEESESSRAG